MTVLPPFYDPAGKTTNGAAHSTVDAAPLWGAVKLTCAYSTSLLHLAQPPLVLLQQRGLLPRRPIDAANPAVAGATALFGVAAAGESAAAIKDNFCPKNCHCGCVTTRTSSTSGRTGHSCSGNCCRCYSCHYYSITCCFISCCTPAGSAAAVSFVVAATIATTILASAIMAAATAHAAAVAVAPAAAVFAAGYHQERHRQLLPLLLLRAAVARTGETKQPLQVLPLQQYFVQLRLLVMLLLLLLPLMMLLSLQIMLLLLTRLLLLHLKHEIILTLFRLWSRGATAAQAFSPIIRTKDSKWGLLVFNNQLTRSP